MGMTPDQFFEAFVLGNHEDCQQHPGCIRRAFNAAVSASHLADHYFSFYQKHNALKVGSFATKSDFLEHLSNATGGCSRDIRSISNAYKHLYTSTDPDSSISSTGAIESDSFVIDEECAEDSKSSKSKSKVVFTRKDGQRIDFLPTLDTVIEFWKKLFN